MRSIIYWHPSIYSLFVRLMFGKHYLRRYEVIRDLIEDNSTLVDVCCGDCKIFGFLENKNVDYLGLDFNPIFIKDANKRGIKAKIFDIYRDEIPKADYVFVQASLYQFIPQHKNILQKLFDASSKYLIISEPVNNVADSKSKIISFIAKILNDPGDGIKRHRFNINSLTEALNPFRKYIVKEFLDENNIEFIVVIKK